MGVIVYWVSAAPLGAAHLLWGLVPVGPSQVMMGLRGGGLRVGLAPALCSSVVSVGAPLQPRRPTHVVGAIRIIRIQDQDGGGSRQGGWRWSWHFETLMFDHVCICEVLPLCAWLALGW